MAGIRGKKSKKNKGFGSGQSKTNKNKSPLEIMVFPTTYAFFED